MAHDFPFVKIPRELSLVIGKATPGTRLFRREGSQKEISKWYDAMNRCIDGGCVSPGGVSMFVPVSRSAVHHRLKKGLLTAFSFYVTEDEKSFFGTTRKRKERPYVYIPVAECRAWAEELKRWKGVGYDPASEMDEEEGWQFVVKDPADRGRKGLVYGEPRMTREETMLEIQTALRFLTEEVLAKLLPGKLAEKHRKRLMEGLSYNYKTEQWSWGSEVKGKPK